MWNNFMVNNSQKGVSLIITFFITIIILFVVLAISAILYSEIKIIRNIGNSVVAFYAADSGVEKVLYYDRQELPAGAERGICNICSVGVCPDCVGCNLTGLDCNLQTCSDCQVVFSGEIEPNKHYNIDITVSQQCKISTGTINSHGFYKDASRAIMLDSALKVSSLGIFNPGATADIQANGVNMTIAANILDPNGVGIDNVVAAITGPGAENYNQCDPAPALPFTQCTYREVTMSPGGGGDPGSHIVQWNFGLVGENYNISIMATDNDGYCTEVKNITINYD